MWYLPEIKGRRQIIAIKATQSILLLSCKNWVKWSNVFLLYILSIYILCQIAKHNVIWKVFYRNLISIQYNTKSDILNKMCSAAGKNHFLLILHCSFTSSHQGQLENSPEFLQTFLKIAWNWRKIGTERVPSLELPLHMHEESNKKQLFYEKSGHCIVSATLLEDFSHNGECFYKIAPGSFSKISYNFQEKKKRSSNLQGPFHWSPRSAPVVTESTLNDWQVCPIPAALYIHSQSEVHYEFSLKFHSKTSRGFKP